MAVPGLFTVIIDTYYRPALLKEAVGALQRQTYDNLEIILVNNGATPETAEYLHEVAALDDRIKLVHFQENQFSWDDPLKMLDVCLNAALEVATGDYVWYQADDDLIADDYLEKIAALFRDNPDCTTATGITVPIDFDGNIIHAGPRTANFRPRYMPGHLLALDVLRGGTTLYSSPGENFALRRDVLVAAGGFHRALDDIILYGILPFGVTGFDKSAILHWRNHPAQLGRLLMARGQLGIREQFALLGERDIEGRWQAFGPSLAQEVVYSVKKRIADHGAVNFIVLLYTWNFPASLRIAGALWSRPYFWLRGLVHAKEIGVRRWVFHPLWRLGRPLINLALRSRSGLIEKNSSISRLLGRINQ